MTAKQLIKWIGVNNVFDFAKGKTLTEVWATCESPDWMLWLYQRSKNPEKAICIKIHIYCAELTLPDFEKRYPEDDRPRKAIEAAKAWVESPTEENRLACETAAKSASNTEQAYNSACVLYSDSIAESVYPPAYAFATAACSYSAYLYVPAHAYATHFNFLIKEQRKEIANYIRKLTPSIDLK